MWTTLLDGLLNRLIRHGTLDVTTPDGKTRRYGDVDGVPVALRISDPSLPRRLVCTPEMALGEGFMDGTLIVGDGDIRRLLGLIVANRASGGSHLALRLNTRFQHLVRRLNQRNPVGRAKRNVAHHYDLSGALYDLFLDEDRQYSCAYFRCPDMTLEQAQEAKKRHIAAKLLIEPGMKVLDIGCGWGGMGLTLARDYGAEVLGVTLSEEQHGVAEARARAAGLPDRARFRLCDYRDVQGRFDRIVSVGMFEHVGVPHYREFFRNVRALLTDDGVALLHTIGRASPPGVTSPWILKYIFPGGYIPSLSEAAVAIEAEDLWVTDIEFWRLHYAETLKHWQNRFNARIDEARALYDDRFCRMWQFYLAAAEVTFREDHQEVFQIQLTRRQDAVPLTRDYLYRGADEAVERAAE